MAKSIPQWLLGLALITLLCVPSAALGAAAVWLNNYYAQCPIIGDAQLAVDETYHIEVLGGALGGVLVSVLPLTNQTSGIGFTEPGYFDGGIDLVPGLADGQQAEFQIHAWKRNQPWSTGRYSAHWTQATGAYPATNNSPAPMELRIPGRLFWVEQWSYEDIVTVLLPISGKGRVEVSPRVPYFDRYDPGYLTPTSPPPALKPWPPPEYISLHAVPDPGYVFVRWTAQIPFHGEDVSTNDDFGFGLAHGTAVVLATFKRAWKLQVEVPFGGWVTNSPSALDYIDGAEVSLEATARPDFEFAGWTGDITSIDPNISVKIRTNTTLVTNFRPVTLPALVVRPPAWGDGVFSNGFGFSLLGEVGKRYRIDFSPDLTNWLLFSEATATSSITPLRGLSISDHRQRFYRVGKTASVGR